METGISDSDPRAMLLPESVPIIRSMLDEEEDSNSTDLPSTVDMEALKVFWLF